MKKSIIILTIILSNFAFSQLPSGVALNLDPEEGIYTNGILISQWFDKNNQLIFAKQEFDSLKPSIAAKAMNGKNAIRFGGTQFMEVNPIFPVNEDYSLFFVVSISNFAYTNNIISGINHAIYYNPPRVLHGDFNTLAISMYPFELNKPTLITIKFRQDTKFAEIYYNGLLGDSAFVGANSDSVFYLGAFRKGNNLAGDLGEIILYKNYLSNTDQKKVQDYLFNKYTIKKPVEPTIDYTFSKIPRTYQLFPRDKGNLADIEISGNFTIKEYDSIKVLKYRDNLLIETQSKKLNFINDIAPFSFKFNIKAELKQYKFVVLVKNDFKDSLITIRDSIVCGDVILINGQSNSIFGGIYYSNEFIRTFGGNFSNAKKDTNWALASAVGSGGGNSIGAWGMRLGQLIIENQQIPICIINGGVGGTIIESHLRDNSNKYNLGTIYGSMLYRVDKSELKNSATSMFWYQGESNGLSNYFQNFYQLYNSWIDDFPNLKKIYVVQIHTGCAVNETHSELRELQRILNDTIKGIPIETIAASGLPGHDGCHYSADGYNALGKILYRIYAKDFYESDDTIAISSPNINKIFFNNIEQTQLAMVFKPKLSNIYFQNDTLLNSRNESLKDYIYLDDSTHIKELFCNGDTLFANLEKPSKAKNVTYLPDSYYNGTTTIYEGPWIFNQRSIGALSFSNFRITSKLISSVENEDLNSDIFLSNNPSNGNFNINIRLMNENNIDISIYNLHQDLIFNRKRELFKSGQHIIPINLYETGIYLCKVNIEGQFYLLKAIVIK